jgi:Immunity protein 26
MNRRHTAVAAQTYKEGDWFAVPMPRGFAVGLVARQSKRGPLILGYFFGPLRKQLPGETELAQINAEQASLICRLKDGALHRGLWRVVAHHPHWRRKDWPLPAFLRREGLSGRGIRIEYDGDNLTTPSREQEASIPDLSLPEDVVLDESRVVDALGKLLAEQKPVTIDPSHWVR